MCADMPMVIVATGWQRQLSILRGNLQKREASMPSSITIAANSLQLPRAADHGPAKPANGLRKSRNPHVVAILPRGEVIRNFVYTGALDEAASHVDLSVLSVVPNDELLEMLRQRYSSVLPLQETTEKWIVGAQRELLDMAHGRWL